jgi:hypothetical protein
MVARHQAGEARVVPVILRPCAWQGTPFADLEVLPEGGTAVTAAENRDAALLAVTLGVEAAIRRRR